MGGGDARNKFMKNPVNLFLELKIISTFQGEISSPSERHDINAKASEDKQKAPAQSFPRLSVTVTESSAHHNDPLHPARLSQILFLYLTVVV